MDENSTANSTAEKIPRKLPKGIVLEPLAKIVLPEHGCAITLDSYRSETPSGDMAIRHRYCESAAAWVPVFTFHGTRTETVQTGATSRKAEVEYTWKLRSQPVCDAHMPEAQKRPSILLTDADLNEQERSWVEQGWPKPNPQRTELTFEPFTPPIPQSRSHHLQALEDTTGSYI